MTKSVLLIEDEANIIEAVTFILKRDGWDVKNHSNGLDAIDAIRMQTPDVVILDVMLPGKSGFEIIKDIRAESDLQKLPVLMLTARGQERDRNLAQSSGVNRYMTKPFSNTELREAVEELSR